MLETDEASCTRTAKGVRLNKAEGQQGVLFTPDRGTLPVWSVHFYCETCNISYHHDFKVEGSIQFYYHEEELPKILQIGKHQFAERRLINAWISLMLYSWTSASNCARWYNNTIAFTSQDTFPEAWQFRPETTRDQVHTAFTVLALLEDCRQCQTVLSVPHDGNGKDRFTAAVKERNARLRQLGVGQLNHCCTVPRTKSCSDTSHRKAIDQSLAKGKAMFQLKARLEHAKVAHLNDAMPFARMGGEPGGEDTGNVSETEDDTSAKSTNAAASIKVRHGRKRTHNEQLFVAPCGVIVARETFYGAEAVGSVVEMIKKVYKDPKAKPEHIFFDNNCTLAKMVKNDDFFGDIGLTVDIFHFKSKHSVTDQFFQTHCNPANFPELHSTDSENGRQVGWYFNSSIAEQTNAWIRAYISICREMHVNRYNFFLDEMILCCNEITLKKLRSSGARPFVVLKK
ncbi:hypothetical protein EST38_g11661 [Candolleomyces aberdarensis]|uniref:CxC5 like cysteine cluster associated with KDZ domain-containing protein n=1 Tax=Candolleomyces aberdarensis TaxID=2316362 RepID=A0A4Q2D6L2_9AGAR|nr:hypothetical protein EST38_g11661 [Candolleomyces aberdarensis]